MQIETRIQILKTKFENMDFISQPYFTSIYNVFDTGSASYDKNQLMRSEIMVIHSLNATTAMHSQ